MLAERGNYLDEENFLNQEGEEMENIDISHHSSRNDLGPDLRPIPKDLPQETLPFATSQKIHEIQSDEETYLVHFEQEKEKLKVFVEEKDYASDVSYENYFTMDELIQINSWFKIFYNMKDLLQELDLLTRNESLDIKLVKEGEIRLFIIFPSDLMENIELILPQNGLHEKEMFKQLYNNLLEIEQKHKEETKQINENLSCLENLIKNGSGKFSDLERMKDTLKDNIYNMNLNSGELFRSSGSYPGKGLIIDQKRRPFIETTILTKKNGEFNNKELKLLLDWIGPALEKFKNHPRTLRTKLLYKASIDGDKASTFHEKCDNLWPTITFIKTKEGFRYGGYTSVGWESPEKTEFKEDPAAFIFSFDTKKKYETTSPEKSIQCSMFWGPYFGEGGTICVPDNCFTDSNAFYQWPATYNLSEQDELTMGKEHYIHINDYEVYLIELSEEELSE